MGRNGPGSLDTIRPLDEDSDDAALRVQPDVAVGYLERGSRDERSTRWCGQ
jgi:hypothetical protein